MSTEKFDIIMANPDVAVFHPFTADEFQLSEDEQERFLDKWGYGKIGWRHNTRLTRDLLTNQSGGYRNFGAYLDEEKETDEILGLPSNPSSYVPSFMK